MNHSKRALLKEKFIFNAEEMAGLFGIQQASAKVLCSRYAQKGSLIRLKRNFYTLDQTWEQFSEKDLFKVANFLQVPSYISFMTALAYYEVTTQVQQDFFESASLKRSVQFNIKGKIFNYTKLKENLYFDFTKKEGLFIASKEKAFVDSIYLYSFGKYKIDIASLDLKKLDKKKLISILKKFPEKTKSKVGKLCHL